MYENEIGSAIVDCAVQLHQALGPGLLESAYEVTLARQMEKLGLAVQRQSPCLCGSVRYKPGEQQAEQFGKE
jgi:GxxExxY protein